MAKKTSKKKTKPTKTESKKTQPGKTRSKKAEPKKSEKQKTMNKKLRLLISILVIICVIGLVWIILGPDVAKADEPKAQLIIESGIVQVKHTGESWTAAEDGMDLYESDSIKTGDNSTASIILFKSSIIRLDSNTEVTLKEIIKAEETSVKIKQDAGRIWNTVSKVSGIDNYDVETPTAVASVRGTSFDIDVDEEGITIVKVIKGIVNVTLTKEGTVYTVQLNENYSITVDFDEMGDPQPFEVDDWINNNLLKDESFKEDLKNKLYEKIEPYIEDLKNEFGMTDKEIEILIDGYIEGEFSIPPETPEKYKKLFDLS